VSNGGTTLRAIVPAEITHHVGVSGSSGASPIGLSNPGSLVGLTKRYIPARILLADDHEIVREGISQLIARSRPEWGICGQARNGEQAIEAVRALQPDVVILDISPPKASGLEVAARITDMRLKSRVLMFTMHESERLPQEVRAAGAQGIVLKSQAARDLIRAIDVAQAGGTFFGS
jgi:DNA-binding NarL/FixJ family response regulator